MVDSESAEGYRPSTDYVEDSNEALFDHSSMTDSAELWLLKFPYSNDLFSDINGQDVVFNLNNDGNLASFEGSSGKMYDLVSFAAQVPDETVFVSSATDPKIAGKISRRVSSVHYPDPKELGKLSSISAGQAHRNSAGATVTTSSRYFGKSSQSGPAASSKGSRQKSSVSSKGSRQKNSVSEVTEPSNTAKRKRVASEDRSNGSHVSEFSRGHSTGISSMPSDHSHGGKSKRRKHKE